MSDDDVNTGLPPMVISANSPTTPSTDAHHLTYSSDSESFSDTLLTLSPSPRPSGVTPLMSGGSSLEVGLADAPPRCHNLGAEGAIELPSFTQEVDACAAKDIDATPLPVSVLSSVVCSAVSTIPELCIPLEVGIAPYLKQGPTPLQFIRPSPTFGICDPSPLVIEWL